MNTARRRGAIWQALESAEPTAPPFFLRSIDRLFLLPTFEASAGLRLLMITDKQKQQQHQQQQQCTTSDTPRTHPLPPLLSPLPSLWSTLSSLIPPPCPPSSPPLLNCSLLPTPLVRTTHSAIAVGGTQRNATSSRHGALQLSGPSTRTRREHFPGLRVAETRHLVPCYSLRPSLSLLLRHPTGASSENSGSTLRSG